MPGGALPGEPLLIDGPAGLAIDLTATVAFPARGSASVAVAMASGAETVPGVNSVGQARDGARSGSFHDIWLDRIHVIPPSTDLGFVLSTTTFAVLVWNAYLSRAATLDSIDITGPPGVSVDDIYGTPTHYAGSQARSYDVVVEAGGGAAVDNIITFDFLLVVDGTLTIVGRRVVPFPISPNMRAGIRERLGYLTDVLTSDDQTEQRRQLRAIPLRGVALDVTTLTASESTYLESLLFGWQDRAYGVPLWWDAQPLLQPISPAQTTIYVDTTGRDFEVGGLVMVWRDPHDWEVFEIDAVNAGDLDVGSQTLGSFATLGTVVVPLRVARLPTEVTINRGSVDTAEVSLEFDVEAWTL